MAIVLLSCRLYRYLLGAVLLLFVPLTICHTSIRYTDVMMEMEKCSYKLITGVPVLSRLSVPFFPRHNHHVLGELSEEVYFVEIRAMREEVHCMEPR
jgi:hypothetical protein